MSSRIVFTKQAQKDATKLAACGLRANAEELTLVFRESPYRTISPYEKLVGDITGAYSWCIAIQHRLVYPIREDGKTVKISQMWIHRE